jgi:hypothetical protein
VKWLSDEFDDIFDFFLSWSAVSVANISTSVLAFIIGDVPAVSHPR